MESGTNSENVHFDSKFVLCRLKNWKVKSSEHWGEATTWPASLPLWYSNTFHFRRIPTEMHGVEIDLYLQVNSKSGNLWGIHFFPPNLDESAEPIKFALFLETALPIVPTLFNNCFRSFCNHKFHYISMIFVAKFCCFWNVKFYSYLLYLAIIIYVKHRQFIKRLTRGNVEF